MERGVSVLLSAQILAALEVLRSGKVDVRISADVRRPVHAKVYKGDGAVTLGSSNFSVAGMEQQVEANARFTSALRATASLTRARSPSVSGWRVVTILPA